jgi:predicted RNA binding protein YcfA (HicA-like mRNA interferase family)
MGRMAQVVAARLVRALGRLGWVVDRQSGSHVVLVKPGRPPITVPLHRGKTLKEGTARAILKQAGVSEQDLFDVY